MNRQLLLISNPGNPNDANYAPSTEEAIMRWKDFFQSPIGGYWQNGEIEVYGEQRPLGSDELRRMVEVALDTVQCDYSVIVFCGHGCTTVDGKDAIQLPIPSQGDDRLFPVENLLGLHGANVRRTVIIDACRSLIPFTSQQLFEQRQYSEVYRIDGIECGKFYNSLIMEANPHVELLQSTNLHNRAYGTATGSVYVDTVSALVNKSSINWKQLALMNNYGQFSFSMLQMQGSVHAALAPQGRQIPEHHSTVQEFSSFPFVAMHLPTDRVIHTEDAIVEILED